MASGGVDSARARAIPSAGVLCGGGRVMHRCCDYRMHDGRPCGAPFDTTVPNRRRCDRHLQGKLKSEAQRQAAGVRPK